MADALDKLTDKSLSELRPIVRNTFREFHGARPAPDPRVASIHGLPIHHSAALFEMYVQERSSKVDWGEISPPPEGVIISHAAMPEASPDGVGEAMSKLAVLKLNGGRVASRCALCCRLTCAGPAGWARAWGALGPKVRSRCGTVRGTRPAPACAASADSGLAISPGLSFLDMTVLQIQHLNQTYEVRPPRASLCARGAADPRAGRRAAGADELVQHGRGHGEDSAQV